MPASWLHITVKLTDRDSTYVKNKLRTNTTSAVGDEKRRVARGIINILNGVVSGVHGGQIWVGVSADNASKPAGAIACTQANASGDTVTFTFGGTSIVFTEASSDATLGFARGASNTACGDNLAAKINAHPILSKLLTAVAVTGTITLTHKHAAQSAPPITLATNDATAFGLTQFTGGTAGASAIQFQNVRTGRTP